MDCYIESIWPWAKVFSSVFVTLSRKLSQRPNSRRKSIGTLESFDIFVPQAIEEVMKPLWQRPA